MINFDNVSKFYPDTQTWALANVSFYIAPGEFVFIVGSSGAGKSTLTKLMMGEEKCTEGTVVVNGINTGELTPKELTYFRRSIGMVFQDFRLLRSKNVFENVAFALRVVGARSSEIKRVVANALEMVDLSDKRKVMPGQLSGGEQQRVALARAMANNPALLIADEPTGNLDPEMSVHIMQLLEEINRFGTTVVVITHDREIVNSMHKRVIELDTGYVVRDEENAHY